jgi:hypothetical protein
MRRDNPLLVNRIDRQADAMSIPADPEAVLEAFIDTHEGMIADEESRPAAQAIEVARAG